jgi:hypothetical protein
MEQIWITLLSIVAGAGGYLIATFWVRPILRYKDLKYEIASDLVFFANAIELQKLDGSLREDTLTRKDANRRRASDLAAIYDYLPAGYRRWLQKHKEDPKRASSELIGLSNELDVKEAKRRIQSIKACLRISLERP